MEDEIWNEGWTHDFAKSSMYHFTMVWPSLIKKAANNHTVIELELSKRSLL